MNYRCKFFNIVIMNFNFFLAITQFTTKFHETYKSSYKKNIKEYIQKVYKATVKNGGMMVAHIFEISATDFEASIWSLAFLLL